MFVRQKNRLFQLMEFIDDLLLLRFFKYKTLDIKK